MAAIYMHICAKPHMLNNFVSGFVAAIKAHTHIACMAALHCFMDNFKSGCIAATISIAEHRYKTAEASLFC